MHRESQIFIKENKEQFDYIQFFKLRISISQEYIRALEVVFKIEKKKVSHVPSKTFLQRPQSFIVKE